MRSLTRLVRLFNRRWAPAVVLASASLSFALLATKLAPQASRKSASTPRTPTIAGTSLFNQPTRTRVTEAAGATREPSPSPSRTSLSDKVAPIPNIVSFFPPPAMELPPPLVEEEPPPPPP
jgi:hypothetical protein